MIFLNWKAGKKVFELSATRPTFPNVSFFHILEYLFFLAQQKEKKKNRNFIKLCKKKLIGSALSLNENQKILQFIKKVGRVCHEHLFQGHADASL